MCLCTNADGSECGHLYQLTSKKKAYESEPVDVKLDTNLRMQFESSKVSQHIIYAEEAWCALQEENRFRGHLSRCSWWSISEPNVWRHEQSWASAVAGFSYIQCFTSCDNTANCSSINIYLQADLRYPGLCRRQLRRQLHHRGS